VFSRPFAKFHAGAVSFGRHGILLPGPRRCGKSVLTLGLLLKGGHYLSEDVAVLEHRSLQLIPCGSGVSLRRDGLDKFPELNGRWEPIPSACADDPFEQIAFTSPDSVGACVADRCNVSMIVFPVFEECAQSARLQREFLRRVIVGSGTTAFVAGDYVKPELETLLGPRVAHAKGSGYYRNNGRRRRGGDDD
jgi:hypothetical protein